MQLTFTCKCSSHTSVENMFCNLTVAKLVHDRYTHIKLNHVKNLPNKTNIFVYEFTSFIEVIHLFIFLVIYFQSLLIKYSAILYKIMRKIRLYVILLWAESTQSIHDYYFFNLQGLNFDQFQCITPNLTLVRSAYWNNIFLELTFEQILWD